MDGNQGRTARSTAGGRRASGSRQTATPRRIDRLAEAVDRCLEAQQIAEQLNEKFLSYLLAMAIQETRSAMRLHVTTTAELKTDTRPPGALT